MSPIVENFKKSNPASSEFRKYIRTQAVMNQIDRLIEAGNDLRAEALILRNIRDPKVQERLSTMCKFMEPVAETPATEETTEEPVAETPVEKPAEEAPVVEEASVEEPVAEETIEVAEPAPKKRGRKTTKTEE